MDSPDQRAAISRLIQVLRRITRVVQVIPFVYLALLSLYLLTESILPDWALRIADNGLNMPMLGTIGLLGAGRILKLCQWFKAACILPVATKVENIVDSFIITLTQTELVAFNIILGILFITYISISYRHFFAR